MSVNSPGKATPAFTDEGDMVVVRIAKDSIDVGGVCYTPCSEHTGFDPFCNVCMKKLKDNWKSIKPDTPFPQRYSIDSNSMVDEKDDKTGSFNDEKRQDSSNRKVTFYGSNITIEMVSTALRSQNIDFDAIRQYQKGKVIVFSDNAKEINNQVWNNLIFHGVTTWTRCPNDELPPTHGWINGIYENYSEKQIAKASGALKATKKSSGVKLIFGSPHELYEAILMGAKLPTYKKIYPWVSPPRSCWRCGSKDHLQKNCNATECSACHQSECLDSDTFCSTRRRIMSANIPEQREELMNKLTRWIERNASEMIVKNTKPKHRMPHMKTRNRTWKEVTANRNIKRRQRPARNTKDTASCISRSPETSRIKTEHTYRTKEQAETDNLSMAEKVIADIENKMIDCEAGRKLVSQFLEAEQIERQIRELRISAVRKRLNALSTYEELYQPKHSSDATPVNQSECDDVKMECNFSQYTEQRDIEDRMKMKKQFPSLTHLMDLFPDYDPLDFFNMKVIESLYIEHNIPGSSIIQQMCFFERSDWFDPSNPLAAYDQEFIRELQTRKHWDLQTCFEYIKKCFIVLSSNVNLQKLAFDLFPPHQMNSMADSNEALHSTALGSSEVEPSL